jgi:hypothetical protein
MPMERVSPRDAITKPAFYARLRAWLRDTDDAAVGAPDVIGVVPWVHVRHGDSLYKLHADTRREAVSRYLKLVDEYGDDLEWLVVPNERGRENALAYGPQRVRIVPFYFYLVGVA